MSIIAQPHLPNPLFTAFYPRIEQMVQRNLACALSCTVLKTLIKCVCVCVHLTQEGNFTGTDQGPKELLLGTGRYVPSINLSVRERGLQRLPMLHLPLRKPFTLALCTEPTLLPPGHIRLCQGFGYRTQTVWSFETKTRASF